MFEQVVIRRHETRGSYIDPGALAEALLFYGNVHLLLDGSTLSALLKTIGPDLLLTLIDQKRITATWLTDTLGVMTNTRGALSYLDFSTVKIAKEANGKRIRDRDMVTRTYIQALGATNAVRKQAEQLTERLEFRAQEPVKHRPDGTVAPLDENGLIGQTRKDVHDRAYLRQIIKLGLQQDIPKYALPSNWDFELIRTADGFLASTNLNFEVLNREYQKRTPPSENSITPAWLLGRALTARSDMIFAADYMSEFMTDPVSSELVQYKMNEILKRRAKSHESIQAFQETELKGARAIRETINAGEKTFGEFVSLLDKAGRFKDWLKGQNPDVSLLAKYHEAVLRETWIDKLPSRATRFVLFALGAIGLEQIAPGGSGIAAGVALSAADTFLLDRLFDGWRPSHFVNGPLSKFIDD